MMTYRHSEEQIRVRFTSMLTNMCNSLNQRVKFIADRGIALSSTLIGENLSYVRSKMINALPLELVLQKRSLSFTHLSDQDNCAIAAINEPMEMDSVFVDFERNAFCNSVVEHPPKF